MRARASAPLVVVAPLALVAALAFGCGRGSPGPTARPPATEAPASRAHRDPRTGQFGAPPAGTTPAPGAGLTSPAPPVPALRELAGPRGGVMMRLDGRFHSQVRATRAPHGALVTACGDGQDHR